MVSADEKSADGGDDLLDSPTTDSFQSMPLHMFRLHPGGSSPVRLKRKQVKNACTNCQKACKKCDEARPCLRCVKYGHGPEECMDSQRKERKKGAKRGPYRKRDGKGNNITPSDDPSQDGEPDPSSPQAGSSPPTTPLVGPMPVGYGPNFYTQFPLPPGHKPGEPAYYPQFYLTPVHPPPIAGLATEGSAYPPPPQFFPATFMAPYPQPFPPYIMHTRPDGQMVAQYPAPPVEVTSPYVKPSAPANSTEGKPPDASKN
ncbi:hypothetical protein C8R43DRAFT_1052760 [Mycena crocata]|nr:hypothetical protein C8R43DRAFT_1052760 [Mycena crocata]